MLRLTSITFPLPPYTLEEGIQSITNTGNLYTKLINPLFIHTPVQTLSVTAYLAYTYKLLDSCEYTSAST